MNFTLQEAIEILERTPQTMSVFLTGLSKNWLECNEGQETWNVTEVIEHLIEGEKHNWLPRLEFILQEGDTQPFPEFDRFSHLRTQSKNTIEDKLLIFINIRAKNLKELKSLVLSDSHLDKTGFHPTFGKVKVRELISTWVVHDLTHLSQIVRIMSERYRDDVGPWKEFLGILKK